MQNSFGTLLAVTESDTVDETIPAYNGVICTGAGNATVVTMNGVTLAFTGLVVGQIINLGIKRVNSTGYTAVLKKLFP